MNVACPDCRTVYRIDPARVPAAGVRARCVRCPGEFEVEHDEGAARFAPTDLLEALESGIPPGESAPPVGVGNAASEQIPGTYTETLGAQSQSAERLEPTQPAQRQQPEPQPYERNEALRQKTQQIEQRALESQEVQPADPVEAVLKESKTGELHDLKPEEAQGPYPNEAVLREAQSGEQPDPKVQEAQPAERYEPVPQETQPDEPPLPPPPFGSADPQVRARRLARALVSDMVVYNSERRDRSLREGTLRQEFRDEIRKSWEEYVSQVGNEISRETSYFQEALNEILAGGARQF